MSGIDFTHARRADEATKQLPVLTISTNAGEDDILEALRAGVNHSRRQTVYA